MTGRINRRAGWPLAITLPLSGKPNKTLTMLKLLRIILPGFIIIFCCIGAATEAIPEFEKMKFTDVVTTMPATMGHVWTMSTSKDSLWPWVGIIASTGILIHYDQDILDDVQKRGRNIGLLNKNNYEPLIRVGKAELLRTPQDFESGLYFLGDGWLHGSVAAGFLAVGYLNDHPRPFNTSLQLIQGFTLSTIASQLLKRVFGREGPVKSTQPGGAWRPFPSIKSYNRDHERFDAIPSGHIMTATLTFTVIRSNYPEYDYIMLPTEIAFLTLLGLQMINSNVHWAGDYPLGIAMGYVFGKAVSRIGRKPPARADEQTAWDEPIILPGIANGSITTNLIWNF